MSNNLLPWHSPQWQDFLQSRAQQRLPHALLLSGPMGLGKRVFAQAMLQSLLCEQEPIGSACNHCAGCALYANKAHPDYQCLRPEEESQEIRIDAVRKLCTALTLSPSRGGYRVALVDSADQLNHAAANSFLKTLEEPNSDTLLLLLNDGTVTLPATLRSRCQEIRFHLPPKSQALTWLGAQTPHANPAMLLSLAMGAPLRALQLANDPWLERRHSLLEHFLEVVKGRSNPSQIAAQWDKEGARPCLAYLRDWTMDMIRIHHGFSKSDILHSDLYAQLEPLAQAFSIQGLFKQLDRVLQALRLQSSSVNTLGLLEDLLIAWANKKK